jgi:hypothetical protein
MNNEVRKEAIVALFKVLSWHLPGRTEENHGSFYSSRYLGGDLNPGPPEYEAGSAKHSAATSGPFMYWMSHLHFLFPYGTF